MNFFDKLKYLYFKYIEMPTQDKKVDIPEQSITSDKYLYFKKFDTQITTNVGKHNYSEIIACTGKDNECARFIKINDFVANNVANNK